MYSTEGDGRRICETSLRKYAQLNFSTSMAFNSPPPSAPRPLCERLPSLAPPPPIRPFYVPIYSVALEFSVRLVASGPRSPRFDPSFFPSPRVLFLSRLSPLYPGPVLSLSSSAATPVARSLFCHGALVLAVPLYLPPPRRSIIPQSRGV